MPSSAASTQGTLAIFIVGLTSIIFIPSLLCVFGRLYVVSCKRSSSSTRAVPGKGGLSTEPTVTDDSTPSTENSETHEVETRSTVVPPPPPRRLWSCGFICCLLIAILSGMFMLYYIQLIRNDPSIMHYNPYVVLGLDYTADDATVRTTYRTLSKRWHPDKPGGDADRFREISRAYNALTNPQAIENMKNYGNPEGSYFGGINVQMIYNLVPAANNISGRGLVVFLYVFGLVMLFSCCVCPCNRIKRWILKQFFGIETVEPKPHAHGGDDGEDTSDSDEDDEGTTDSDDDGEDNAERNKSKKSKGNKGTVGKEKGLFPPGITAQTIPADIRNQLLDSLTTSGIVIEMLNNAQRFDLLSLVLPSTIKDPLSLSFAAQREIIKKIKDMGSKTTPRDIARILKNYPVSSSSSSTGASNKAQPPITNTIVASKKGKNKREDNITDSNPEITKNDTVVVESEGNGDEETDNPNENAGDKKSSSNAKSSGSKPADKKKK